MKEVKTIRKKKNEKVGIVIATNDSETCWVAIRYATFHLMEQKDVKIYFVDSGLKYKDMRDGKYNIVKLVECFTQAGGQVYLCDDREKLKACLISHFSLLLNKKDIVSMSDDDKFQSVMTESAYLREFKKVI